jgi:holo-[acyl-carrier protein] synthase
MIYGVGTDLVHIDRIKNTKDINSLALRVLTDTEYSIFDGLTSEQRCRYLAKQFAAKEAISKAFGTGIRGGILMSNMEVLRNAQGKPVVQYRGQLQDIVVEMGVITHISLSDQGNHSVAFAVIETDIY